MMRRVAVIALILTGCESVRKTEEIAPAKEPVTGGIRFTNEQQSLLHMNTATVESRQLINELRVPAEIRSRTGGEAEVTSPLRGNLRFEETLVIGTALSRGQTVASILPPTALPNDLTALELAESEAKVQLTYLTRDRQRAERLVAAGAAPQRRLDEALAAEATAQVRLDASRVRLRQFEANRQAQSEEVGTRRFLVRSPIDGVLTSVMAANGANVDVGTVLFHIADLRSVYAVAHLPEVSISRLRGVATAYLDIEGRAPIRAERLVTIGRVIDPATRTVPVVWEVDNRNRGLALNQSLLVRIVLSSSTSALAVPVESVVDEGPIRVVYVRTGPETFERRPVTTGARSGGWIEVSNGLHQGETVVAKGAYLIRLAAATGEIPTEGHVH